MVEGGVSLARAAFAFNSTNAEGWGLYAESLMIPTFPWKAVFPFIFAFCGPRGILDRCQSRRCPDEAKDSHARGGSFETFAQQKPTATHQDAGGRSPLLRLHAAAGAAPEAELALGPRFEQRNFTTS